jgi:hypothetical protein
MPVVIFVVTAFVVFAIAAITIGRETHRLDAVTPAPALELVDAVAWIADRLPPEVSAQISYEDVRDLVTWHLEMLEEDGVRQTADPDSDLVIVEDQGTIAALVDRAFDQGRAIDATQVRAVLDGELAYLRAIGAVGPLADPEREL